MPKTTKELVTYDISKDAKKHAAYRVALRLGGLFLWISAWGSSIFFYMTEWSSEPDIKMVCFAVGLAFVGIFIFDIPRLLFRKTVDGIVVDRRVTETFAPMTKGGDDENNNMIQTLKIRLSNGKTVTCRSANREDFIRAFMPGTRVRRYKTLKFPEPLDGEYTGKICLVCGSTAKDNRECPICGRRV